MHGCIDSGSGLGAHDHACWAFERRQEFLDAAFEYLTDGLRAGQRIACVGSEPVAEQRERLEPLGGVASMIDEGALALFEVGELYELDKPIDAEAQLSAYAAATDAALGDGYTGLRVAAQVSHLVTDPDLWEAHVRWESVADRFMAARPLSAMCGYQRDLVPSELLSELAAVHPSANSPAPASPFHLFAEGGGMVLAGEVDSSSAETLDRVLAAACADGEAVTLDLWELGFIDRRGLEVLAAHTRRLAASGGCSVRNAPYLVDRLCDLLALEL
jgi:ABC-type transporter Mla MlaB component